jgi:hypothetical protein
MTYFNAQGQGRVGWKSGVIAPTPVNVSSLWTSIYSVYNADAVGSSSLKTSLYAAYNGESNANDSFGSNNGTAVGGLTYTTGKIGNAFNLNGTTSYVSLPNNSLNFTGDFSYSFWVKTNTSGNYVVLGNYTYTGGLNYGYSISLRGNDLYFQITNGATVVNLIYTNSSGWSSQYNHITITRKNSTGSEIYVNGTKVISNTSSINPLYTSTHYPTIGIAQDPAFYWPFNGQIDALSIWNKELTSAEVTELYNSGNGAQYITDSFYKPTTNDALNTYNGTAQGGLTYGVGKVGTAFQFNGTNATITTDNNMAFMFNNAFTFSFWIKPTSFSSEKPIIHNYPVEGGSGQKGFQLVLETNGRLRFRYIRTGNLGGGFSSDSAILLNQWSHVVFSFNLVTGAYQFYTNGTLVKSSTYLVGTSILYPTNTTLNYGQIGSTSYNGSIDAFNVWNRVLTSTEVTELYNSGNGKQYPN